MNSFNLRVPALLAAALLACAPASAQFPKSLGGLLNSLPIPGNSAAVVPAAPVSGSNMGDLLKMLTESLESIDEPKEIEIGRQLSAVLLGAKPLHPDMALQRYVNTLGRWISLQSSRPQLPWAFAVIDDPGFNAFAAPGGFIFITKGVVDRVDEAELAGILAHEITHVTSKHHLQALRSKAMGGLGIGLAGQALAQRFGSSSLAGNVASQFVSLTKEVYSKGLDQGDEFEADRQGVALAARAGFDPFGLPAVLQQLRTATPDNQLFALTISTHPAAQVRLEQLEGAMGNRLDALSGKPSVPVAQRLQQR